MSLCDTDLTVRSLLLKYVIRAAARKVQGKHNIQRLTHYPMDNTLAKGKHTIQSLTQYAWVIRPERPKGAKDEGLQLEVGARSTPRLL